MKKFVIVLSLAMALLLLFASCNGEVKIKDGIYRAEYSDYDQHGYKDFVEVTFKDNKVESVVADAVSGEDGSLKSSSAKFRDAMEPISGTYPEKYYKDLINQYIEKAKSDNLDVIAGATESSNSFISLIKALEKAVISGNTETVVVKRS
ncbi:MAG: FMN-binding protein [Oscillospiraceae bacterium]